MKGNISRDSHRPGKRYSGVFQVQGGMVTDADLGEQATIARNRVDALGHDTACRGVPVKDGAVLLQPDGGGLIPTLREGTVYAEGVRGQVRTTSPVTGIPVLTAQVDFPMAPALPASGGHVVYVDIWERMTSHIEESYLSDPGFHGAETSYRSQTMTQLKWAPASQSGDIEAGAGRFPRIGDGEMTVTETDPGTIFDDCDPCADTVKAEQVVANALYRFEIVSVDGDADAPTSIRIAWSSENASAMAPASVNEEDFERPGMVYEFFSKITDQHLGVHHDSDTAKTTAFVESMSDTPAPASAPGGGSWPFVRRWDGMAVIDFSAGKATRIGAGPLATMVGQVVTIATDSFTAAFDFAGKSVVAGDYWLVELRRMGTPRIAAVQSTPVGILHNYCILFRTTGRTPQQVTDAEERMLSFPFLSDLPATHVGFDNNCTKLYGTAENVQEALDELCNINAADIPFDPTDCARLFDSADNVQDALINLCKIDFGIDRVLRHFMDWGVVCGVIPRLVKRGASGITITEGCILDRAGKLGMVADTQLDLNQLKDEQVVGFRSLEEALAKGEVCLALAIREGGEITPFLIPEALAYEPKDPTFLSVYQECIQKTKSFDFKANLDEFKVEEQAVANKLYYAAGKSGSLGATARLNQAEFGTAQRYNKATRDKYVAFADDPAEGEAIDAEWARLEREINVGGATGATREIRQMQLEAAKSRVVLEQDQRRTLRCLCDALLPRCPVPGKEPFFVPIACLRGKTDNREFFLEEVCVYCCRKQSMNWRMVQYYIVELRDVFAKRLEQVCCPRSGGDGGEGPVVVGPTDFGTFRPDRFTPTNIVEGLDTGVAILQGRQPPNEFTTKVEVNNLTENAAGEVLRGNGVEVAETIDVADLEAIQKIEGKTVGISSIDRVFDAGDIKPGDKVALITQNGVALDYIKLESGAGKYVYSTEAVKVAPSPSAGLTREEIARLEERLAVVQSERTKATTELDRLRTERETLGTEITAAGNEIEKAREDLAALREAQATAAAEIRSANEGLTELTKQRDEMVISIRSNLPLTSVEGIDGRLAATLAESGVTNVGELSSITPQLARRIAQSSGLTAARVTALRNGADTLINRPIR